MAIIREMDVPQVTGLCPLIQVYDMLESVRFYCDRLGFEVARQSPREELPYPYFNWALLRRGATELMLNTAYEPDERPAVRDPAREHAHRDTILYFGCPDVDAAYAFLRARGIALTAPSVSHGMKHIDLLDPDGYAISLHWPAAP